MQIPLVFYEWILQNHKMLLRLELYVGQNKDTYLFLAISLARPPVFFSRELIEVFNLITCNFGVKKVKNYSTL